MGALPTPPPLRATREEAVSVHDFKYHAGTCGASGLGGAVEVAARVENQIAAGMESVAGDAELMDDAVSPVASAAGRKFEECAASRWAGALLAAQHGGSVEVAGRIHHQACDWISCGVTGEGAEQFFRPVTFGVGLQLEYDAGIRVSALIRRAVEVAGSIEDEVAAGIFSTVRAAEGVHDGFGPSVGSWGQFEDCAIAGCAGIDGAVKIAGRIKGQAVVGRSAVGCAFERVEDAFGPSAGAGCELEDGAAAGAAGRTDVSAEQGCPVEIAGGVKTQPGIGFAAVGTAGKAV